MGLISQREFARRNGVSPEAISRAVKAGRIPAESGKIDPAQAQPVWDRVKDPARAGRKLPRAVGAAGAAGPPVASERVPVVPAAVASGFGSRSYTEIKTRREEVRLAREQLELKTLLGKTIGTGDVRDALRGLILNAKSKLLALGHRLAPQVAIETDAARCKELIDEAVHEVLADLMAYDGTMG